MAMKLWLRIQVVLLGCMLVGLVQANSMPSVPNELFEALKIDRAKVTPKELHEALVKRYKDPRLGLLPGWGRERASRSSRPACSAATALARPAQGASKPRP